MFYGFFFKKEPLAFCFSPDPQEPTFDLLVAAKSEARGCAGFIMT
jgi:hypothetical protein